jgi:furry protein family
LLSAADYDNALLEAVIRHSYVTSHNPSSEHYFDVVADVIVTTPQHHFDIHQITWLALVHLGRSEVEIRRKAFRLLDVSHTALSGSTEFARLDSATRSTAPSIYLQAQRQISGILAAANPDTAYGVLAQCTLRLPQARDGQERFALQCLLPWIPNIVIMSSDKELTRQGLGALHNLFSVTVRYGELHADALQSLWATLVTGDRVSNGNAVIKFLIEQATIRCNPAFVLHAKKIVAYMSSTSLEPQIFDELCSVLEPPAMILAQAPESVPPTGEDQYFVEDLDALLPVPKSRQQLSPAELAILFLGDFMPDHPWDHDHHLPTLLHVVFSLLDHRINSVRIQIRRTLFQLLRCWSAGYDRLSDRANYLSHSQLMKTIDALEMDPDAFGGQNIRSTEDLAPRAQQLCGAVIEILRPVYPPIEQYWAEIALFWGNRGPVRELACRSFQIFRILSPTLQGSMAVDMMERLSNTISDTSGTDHRFTREILLTLIDYSKSPSVPATLLPQLFWCASACLSSTVEAEFSLAIDMMNAILDSFDLKLASSVDSLRAHKPRGWGNDELCTERLVFHGLRSSITFETSYHLITRLVEIKGHDVVESSDSRLRLLYVSCLPWCLHIIEDGVADDRLTSMAEAVATLADEEGRTDISRIMTSLSRNRFKRKEDFVKQAVSSLRENYWSDHATEIVTILLGCILNQETWLRVKSLQILKILLQSIDARNPFTLPGSELLMPLLRLLSSEFATQAMEVLDTPMSISGGPSASHVVRMSVHGLMANDYSSDTIVFGSPAESGWCIAHPSDQSSSCRRNVSAVVSTFNVGSGHVPGTMSMILFTQDEETQPSRTEPDIVIHESEHSSPAASLGELVNTLHDLNTFFQSNGPPAPSSKAIGRFDAEEAERRVAAILSRSLARAPLTQEPRSDDAVTGDRRRDWDIPPTPFVDLFAESSSYDSSADALHQNFMRMAEDSDGEEEEDSTDAQQYEASLRQSTPRSNGHTRYRNDSDSEDELNSFSLEDTRGPQGWSNPRSGGVRGLLISKRSPKTERGRKI